MGKSKVFGGSSMDETEPDVVIENSSVQNGSIKRFFRKLGRTPWWLIGLGLVLGFTYTNHDVATVNAETISNLEAAGSFLVFFSLTLTVIRTYGVIRALTLKSKKMKNRTARALSIGGAFLIVTVLAGVLVPSATALRWKLDPAAKIRYEASVIQAAKDETNASEKLRAEAAQAAQAASDKTQLEEKKQAEADQKKLSEEANAKALEVETAKVRAKLAEVYKKSKYLPNGGYSSADLKVLKNIKADLYSFINSWASVVSGSGSVFAVQNACDLISFDLPILGQIVSKSGYFNDLQKNAQVALNESQVRCAFAFKKGTDSEMPDAAIYAAESARILNQILTEKQ